VYSVSNQGSFDRIKRFWCELLRAKRGAPPPVFLLVGNKCDEDTKREVSIAKGDALGKHFLRACLLIY
jgi:GTPase KRas protein